MGKPYPSTWISASLPPQPARRAVVIGVALAIAVGFIFQVVRLNQHDPARWIAVDYAMRITVLVILAGPRPLREVVFVRDWREIGFFELIFWTLIAAIASWVMVHLDQGWAAALPTFRLGDYPKMQGWLRAFDLTYGLALVAIEEELLFRRAMSAALAGLGDGPAMIAASAAVFGAYHWWTGLPGMLFAGLFGAMAMRLYRHGGVLWPLVLLHYFADLGALG